MGLEMLFSNWEGQSSVALSTLDGAAPEATAAAAAARDTVAAAAASLVPSAGARIDLVDFLRKL